VTFVETIFKGVYDHGDAQVTAITRRKFVEKATKQSLEVLQIVRKLLCPKWSLDSISIVFSVELPLQKHVCHSTIYDWIDKDRQRGGKLHTYLPRYGNVAGKAVNVNESGFLLFLAAQTLQNVLRL